MNNQIKQPGQNAEKIKKISPRRQLPKTLAVFLILAVVMPTARIWAQSIPQPVLVITAVSNNSMFLTITNGVSTTNYNIYNTPVLGNTVTYPWKASVIGTNSQTNFTLSMAPYSTGFYRAVLDTNSVPLWEAADPNNPGAGILAVFIDSPANGAVLQ